MEPTVKMDEGNRPESCSILFPFHSPPVPAPFPGLVLMLEAVAFQRVIHCDRRDFGSEFKPTVESSTEIASNHNAA